MNTEKTLLENENQPSCLGAVTSSASQSWRKCKHCGKFLSYKQLEEQKEVMHVFIPDTVCTVEESYWVHKHCW
jgi:acetyl-CoA carboxylase beta subunit